MSIHWDYYLSLLRRKAVICALIGGAIVGILTLGAVRFFATDEHDVHYHANFAVYINGAEQTFKGPQYYQEVTACDAHDSPLTRTHMHDENPHLVHVHADLVTWASFFDNLGWSLGNSMLYDGKTAYVDGQGGELSFILNGKPVRSLAGEVIGSEDRLLISYGSEDEAARQKQYASVPSDAHQANTTQDPAGCKGAHEQDVWTRLREAFLW